MILFLNLTTSINYSQGTIQITQEQAKEAIKTKQRVQVLEVAIQQQRVIITKLQDQVSDQKDQITNTALQNDLLQENYDRLKVQLEAEKAKKPKDKNFVMILRYIGKGVVGFIMGSI